MAQRIVLDHPFWNPPDPPQNPRETPIRRPDPVVFNSGLNVLMGVTDMIFLFMMDEKTSILLSDTYEPYDGPDPGASRWDSPETEALFKTCVAHAVIDEHHPRILKNLGRDPWTGYPLLQTPTGPSLDDFIKAVHMDMYPPSRNSQRLKLSDDFLPLVINWALQSLSALRFIHAHDIVYNRFDKDSCVLSSTLSISLVGFCNAHFGESYGPSEPTYNDPPTVQGDLLDWARMYYILVLGDNQGEYGWHPVNGDPNPGSIHPDFVGRQVLLKLRDQEYADAAAVWDDFVATLSERGFTVEGDGLKDFDPPEALGIHYFRDQDGKITRRESLGVAPRAQSRRNMKKQLWKCELGIDEYIALYHAPRLKIEIERWKAEQTTSGNSESTGHGPV